MTVYNARLATNVTREVRLRLVLAAAVTGKSISATLTDVLDKALPTRQQLASRMQAESPLPADAGRPAVTVASRAAEARDEH